MGLELKKKVSGSFFFFLAFIAKPCLSYSQPLIAIIAISQDTLERRVGNCMESDNQRLRKATRVTRKYEVSSSSTSCAFAQLGILQQNGVAEIKNRHLLEVARAFMFARNVPKFLGEMQCLKQPILSIGHPQKALTPRLQ
ncbi:hypothetical protein CK203_117801 [Vitis vinifera]|uniref:Uncharacterized protein n=1 Tax=Vitis vinifera TaxID=29760 RepID=A0A438DGP3_VITVI|nr:hypothetical protein CK203_117801 [Vitis vinifera]